MRLSDKLFETLNNHFYELHGKENPKEPALHEVLDFMMEVNDFYSTWTEEASEFLERFKEENK